MSDRTDIPSPNAPNFEQRVRETLQTYLGKQGNPLDRGLTLRDLLETGVVKLKTGYTLSGSGVPPIEGTAPTGGVGGTEEPDLTAPPSPTNLAATANITHFFVTHDNPGYTQGHGHLRTRLYGAIHNGGPLPTFANATEIAQFTGAIYAHPSNLATTWHLWAKWETNDGVLSASPAGGTNGVVVTTGKIGNADLGPLIVEAANIANRTITADQIAADAITQFEIDSRGLNIRNSFGDLIFGSDGYIDPVAYISVNNNNVLISDVAANSLIPALNYVGEYATAPDQNQLGANWKQNSVYKNSTDNKSYVLTGVPLGWVVYLSDGLLFSLTVESTNGTIFRVGQNTETILKGRLFKNGAEVTAQTPDSWFRWRRASMIPQLPPNDDTTWNNTYLSGYKQVTVSVDSVYAKATFFCDIISP
jgi:hypothetical protein